MLLRGRETHQQIQLNLRKSRLTPHWSIERPTQLDTHIVACQTEDGVDRLDTVTLAAMSIQARAGGDVRKQRGQFHLLRVD